jgi:putative serine protease PepD
MTHQPPLQPPEDQQHPDVTQHTAPLRDGQTQAQRQYPAYPPVSPQTPSEPRQAALLQPGVELTAQAGRRRLVELVAVAALTAILASAGTYALTRGDVDASPAAQTQSAQSQTGRSISQAPVVQANASAPDWTVTAAVVSPSVVAISLVGGQTSGQGSGVIFDTLGHILTNNHVVAARGQGSKISVTLNDQRTYDATILGTDPSADLAVIRLTAAPNDLKAIALGDSETLNVGEPVMAVGNPLGLAGTVTTGIVSGLNRPVTTPAQQSADPSGQQSAGEPVVNNAVQISAAINPGNSGGALVNASGQLIGINSSIAQLGSSGGSSSETGNIGIGFAIRVNEARWVADQLITSGKATHAFLGVSSKDDFVTQGSAKRAAGVITNVASDGPAAKAGLEAGDAIIAVDGESVDGSLALVAQVRERTAGEKITLTVTRDGQSRQVGVTLANSPAPN